MRTEDLKYFITTAAAGSINKAAQQINISQQALSQSIKAIEDYTGSRLFVRSAKGVSLTDFGKGFLEYAVRISKDADELESYIINNRNSEKSVIKLGLRVSVNSSPISSAISNTVEDFMQQNKNVHISIKTAPQDVLLEDLKAEELDIVQVIGPVDDAVFSTFPVFRFRMMLIAGKEIKLPERPILGFNDIKSQNVVLPNAKNPLCKMIKTAYSTAGIEPKIIAEEASAKTMAHMVHKGYAIGFMPDDSAKTTCDMYPDVKMYGIEPPLYLEYSFVRLKEKKLAPHIKEFVNYIVDNAESNVIHGTI